MKKKYQQLRGIEVMLGVVSIGIFSFYILGLFTISFEASITIAGIFALVAGIVGCRQVRLFTISENDIARYINQKYPQLRESADLLLRKESELSLLQQLQKARTNQQLQALYPVIKIPQHLGRAAALFVLSILLSAFLSSFTHNGNDKQLNNEVAIERSALKANRPMGLKFTITITPPVYLGLKQQQSEDFNIKIPEGATVSWQISFVGNPASTKIILGGVDTVALSRNKKTFDFTKAFSSSTFYQLTWVNDDDITQFSDFGKIEVVKDGPPSIVVENISQFQTLSLSDDLNLNVRATITDDYALSDAYIVATVSKGTGEAIKFREEKLFFDEPKKIFGPKVQANKQMNLEKLGLGPGDELYFYIQARDNKMPNFNSARTETYFITLKDTSTAVTSIDVSLGVDLMPEYFRSQRQIIIDSEKLLREKNKMKAEAFNNRSNELGHDQKILRLRYGEFLGEEFESNIGPHSSGHADGKSDLQEAFTHSHDSENDHNLAEEKQSHQDAQREKKDPLKEFVHSHDGEEEATYFVQSIRAKLKAAITIMWDAELYLRLYQPAKSLPYQYKALKLLKEISQDSRIYVHRTGFDPPPLKEEKRLSGDLSEIKSSTSRIETNNTSKYYPIAAALVCIEQLLRGDTIILSQTIKETFVRAGQALAQREHTWPGRYLHTLSHLKALTQNELPYQNRRKVLMDVRTVLWKILPSKTTAPQPRPGVTHDLDLEFLKSISAPYSTN